MKRVHLAPLGALLLVALGTALAMSLFAYPLGGVDDANIFFVYATNLANGDGFRYNAGGERVEGFTSLLWTVICSLFFALSPTPELGLLLFNVATVSLGAAVAVPALSYLVGLTCLTIFRQVYFGYPLPNTYYAKVSPALSYNFIQGSKYLIDYFASGFLPAGAMLATFSSCLHFARLFAVRREVQDASLLIPVLTAVGILLPVLTGGDHFGSFRFYQNIYPLLLLSLICFFRSVAPQYVRVTWTAAAQRYYRWVAIACLGGAFTVSQAVTWYRFPEKSLLAHEFTLAERGRRTGVILSNAFSQLAPLPSLGVVVAGGIKRTYAGEIIDLMGLSHTGMAHNGGNRKGLKNHAAFEKKTFYELSPAVVCPTVVDAGEWRYAEAASRNSFFNRALRGLFDDERFLASYAYAKLSRTDAPADQAIVGWFSKRLLADLRARPTLLVEIHP